jgi:hypothetical protein
MMRKKQAFPLDAETSCGKSKGMVIFRISKPIVWGELDVPLVGIVRDWFGAPLSPPAGYSLAMDERRLWFLAHHRRAADLHPRARPGAFQAELWKHDVAELFLADPISGRYFEFNLAPNGAWWSCEFTAPRVRAEPADIAMPDVATFADLAPDGSWVAAMALPLDILRARLNFGPDTRANVSMTLESPNQRFLSANALPGDVPDFHQPAHYSRLDFQRVENVLPTAPPALEKKPDHLP